MAVVKTDMLDALKHRKLPKKLVIQVVLLGSDWAYFPNNDRNCQQALNMTMFTYVLKSGMCKGI